MKSGMQRRRHWLHWATPKAPSRLRTPPTFQAARD